MLKYIIYTTLLLTMLFSSTESIAQGTGNAGMNGVWGPWQVTVGIGTQMSGIKDEDFIASNYAPLLNVSVGKWFSPVLALQLGYKGWYFHQIIDDNKYRYGYYYGAAVLNVNRLFRGYRESCRWSLYLHSGAGYFYNYDYKRPNVCAELGICNNYRLSDSFLLNLDVSAIAGWDIYQGDEDILPGVTLGVSYLF